jgi:hypothetical protein
MVFLQRPVSLILIGGSWPSWCCRAWPGGGLHAKDWLEEAENGD